MKKIIVVFIFIQIAITENVYSENFYFKDEFANKSLLISLAWLKEKSHLINRDCMNTFSSEVNKCIFIKRKLIQLDTYASSSMLSGFNFENVPKNWCIHRQSPFKKSDIRLTDLNYQELKELYDKNCLVITVCEPYEKDGDIIVQVGMVLLGERLHCSVAFYFKYEDCKIAKSHIQFVYL